MTRPPLPPLLKTVRRGGTLPCLFLAAVAAVWTFAASGTAHADEHLFGSLRGAETLPKGHFDLYQFATFRTGKAAGVYRGFDFDTELEYGVTDKFQVGIAAINHYFHTRNVDGLDNDSRYRFGGVELSGKYRLLSPFKDVVGLAFHMESGFLINDEVGGIRQRELFFAPSLILQKNFLDDTLIFEANVGVEYAWGKKPAEEYDREFSAQGALGVSYRFAPNWFIGVEGRVRSEYPRFDLEFHEHTVIFAGPSLHYGAKRWWATASWGYQVYGNEVDEVVSNKAFAEEARNEFRLKVGFNF
ncbi:MAG: Conserved hypothetical secreted protein [Chthoniobacteraceae bacterium]|nr:Conserved hypothetical secreted protein [Chthoniobacteraceae bacterium]